MRIYKFLSCEHGLKAIEGRHLKISTLDSLNDPFEFFPFDLSDPANRRAATWTKAQMAKKVGILCFSQDWTNPVIWAHYADCHKGLCLGFDIPDATFAESAKEITYIAYPPPFPDAPDLSTTFAMLYTKFDHWRYETEVRIAVQLNDKTGDLYFKDFGHDLLLAEIVLGVGCILAVDKFLRALGPYANVVRIARARREYSAFKMAKDPIR